MYKDTKRLVKPWNNKPFNSSNEGSQHLSSNSSAVMYSPSKRSPSNEHSFSTAWSCNATDVPVQYGPDRAACGIDRRYEYSRKEQNCRQDPQDCTFDSEHSVRNLDSIFSSGPTKGYYYDTTLYESAGMYNYQYTKASNHSQSDDNVQVHCNTFIDQSSTSRMRDIPGLVDSETSSFGTGGSFDYSDSAESYHSKPCFDQDIATSNKKINPRSMEYHHDGQQRWNANRNDENNHLSQNIRAGAVMSNGAVQQKSAAGSGVPKCKMIEIAPGEFMRLRGAQETWKAIQDDFYLPCACICCELTLFCIQDATYVLCPVCQVVNRLEKIDGYDGGVGLGFTMEELAEWQNDIVMNRRF